MNPLEAYKLWRIYRQTKEEATKMNEQANKPGWKTTEFWLTVLAQVPAVLGIFLGASNPITIGVGAACVVAYTLGRSFNKANASQVALAALKAAEEAAKALPKEPQAPPAK